MTTEIVRKLKPEEEELVRKRQELAGVRALLAEHELELADLNCQLSAFESLYLREVGALYAELDLWQARIAELQAEIAPSEDAIEKARSARQKARETHAATHANSSDTPGFNPSPDLKRLFREVAKRFHPDLAKNGADQELRTRLMAEANRAYRAGDAAALQTILDSEDEFSTGNDFIEDVASELVRVIRQISLARERVEKIESDLHRLRESQLALFMADSNKAKNVGRDLIRELAAKVSAEIRLAQQRYTALISRNQDHHVRT
jgi:DNA repair exonuclease SbcCD ATPase subunit